MAKPQDEKRTDEARLPVEKPPAVRKFEDEEGAGSEWNVVEDLHTSYRLHRDGWTSVYERQPVEMTVFRERGSGRPTKRDRREIEKWRR